MSARPGPRGGAISNGRPYRDLIDLIVGVIDYPFEDMVEARDWLDRAAISDPDRMKIAYSNAQKLFHL